MNFVRLLALSLLTGMVSPGQSSPYIDSSEAVVTTGFGTVLATTAQTGTLIPINAEQAQQCPDYTGLPPVTEGSCSQLQWQSVSSQLHNMNPAARQRFLMTHVNRGLAGRLLWGLAYTQPTTGTTMRQLGLQSLVDLYADMPSSLRSFLAHHIAMNRAMLAAAAEAQDYRQANSALHNDIIQLHLMVQEKVQQIEALTEIESRLSSPPLLERSTRILNFPAERVVDEEQRAVDEEQSVVNEEPRVVDEEERR